MIFTHSAYEMTGVLNDHDNLKPASEERAVGSRQSSFERYPLSEPRTPEHVISEQYMTITGSLSGSLFTSQTVNVCLFGVDTT